MAASFHTTQLLFLLTLFFSLANTTADQPPPNTGGANFSCPADSPPSCETYVAYFANPPNYLNLENISHLFNHPTPSSIANASNLAGTNPPLFPGQLLLVPITCGCTDHRYFANVTYQIKQDDSYYSVSEQSFKNLTSWQVVEEMNPTLNPTLLQIGTEVIFPLFCKCPSKNQSENGITILITYVWQPNDGVLEVGAKFNASPADIGAENGYNIAVGYPVLIPVSRLPALSQSYPSNQSHFKHMMMIIVVVLAICLGGAVLIFLLINLRKRKKTINRMGSSLETSDLIQTKELQPKSDDFRAKLLPVVSGYLSKPIVYESKTIMEATTNFNEHCRIGRSVYRATINGQDLEVKKTKEDVCTEELKILQKVNHTNLVRLIGISSDTCGKVNRDE